MKNVKNIITLALLGAFVLGLSGWAAVKPPDALSVSERRPLAQRPEMTAAGVLSRRFMSDYESYAVDQFPLREQFRTLKALTSLYGYGQKDNNGVYLAGGYAAKLDYPLKEASLTHAAERFRYLYETLMAGTDTHVYFSVIPDKNHFLAEANGYPAYDEQALAEKLAGELEFADYIDLFGSLSLDNYYRTDSHWRQETLLPAAHTLAEAMGCRRTITGPKRWSGPITACTTATPRCRWSRIKSPISHPIRWRRAVFIITSPTKTVPYMTWKRAWERTPTSCSSPAPCPC